MDRLLVIFKNPVLVTKNDFPELHTEIEGVIKSQNVALHLPIMSEIAVTPIEAAPPTPTTSTPSPATSTPTPATSICTPTSVTYPPSPTISLPSPTPSASSRTPTHPTISIPSSTARSPANKPVDNYFPRQSAHPAEVTLPCKFYMRGHCQYGKQGQACACGHPPSLIIILMYRPPCCPTTEFNYIILKTKSYIISLPPPLPNIIM